MDVDGVCETRGGVHLHLCPLCAFHVGLMTDAVASFTRAALLDLYEDPPAGVAEHPTRANLRGRLESYLKKRVGRLDR